MGSRWTEKMPRTTRNILLAYCLDCIFARRTYYIHSGIFNVHCSGSQRVFSVFFNKLMNYVGISNVNTMIRYLPSTKHKPHITKILVKIVIISAMLTFIFIQSRDFFFYPLPHQVFFWQEFTYFAGSEVVEKMQKKNILRNKWSKQKSVLGMTLNSEYRIQFPSILHRILFSLVTEHRVEASLYAKHSSSGVILARFSSKYTFRDDKI